MGENNIDCRDELLIEGGGSETLGMQQTASRDKRRERPHTCDMAERMFTSPCGDPYPWCPWQPEKHGEEGLRGPVSFATHVWEIDAVLLCSKT